MVLHVAGDQSVRPGGYGFTGGAEHMFVEGAGNVRVGEVELDAPCARRAGGRGEAGGGIDKPGGANRGKQIAFIESRKIPSMCKGTSPNQTMFGRMPPDLPQAGQSVVVDNSPFQLATELQWTQRALASSPCMQIGRLPARWCKPSTFWVTRVTRPGQAASSRVMAWCAAFGSTARAAARRML